MPRQRAFTLVELVAVIIVLAVLGGIAIPKFIGSAERAKTAADEGALAGMNTALHAAYMNHRAQETPASAWVATLDTVSGAMETGKLPEGWTVDNGQLIDQRGNRYDFIAETSSSPARIALATGTSSSSSSAGGSAGSGGSGSGTPRSTADIQALAASQIPGADLTPEEFAQLTPAQLASLSPSELAAFSAAHLATLGADQLTALSYAHVQAISASITVAQIPLVRPDQIAMLSATAYGALTPAQLAALTGDQRAERAVSERTRAVAASAIRTLDVAAIKYLLPTQVAGINSDYAMSLISADRRAAFSAEQVQALNSRNVSISYLTEAQRLVLTPAQYAAIRTDDIRHAPVSRLGDIPAATVGAIGSDYAMSLISAERRAAFSTEQVQALNARTVSISYLTEAQRTQLTSAQMGSIRTDDIRYAPVSRLGDIPPATVGAIGSDYSMSLISAERRAAFSTEQVQALNARTVSISYLTEAQRTQLTAAQMASIRTDDIRYAPVSRLGDIPPATVGAIGSDYAMSLISADRRAGFSTGQVQALNARSVSISYLTEAQRTQLTTAQMASIRTDDIRYAPVSRLGDIPPATVGAIGSDYSMSLISAERRAAFSAEQIQAINTVSVSLSYLTDAQREQTTTAQMAAIRSSDVRYAPPSRMSDIPPTTIAAISGSYNWSLVSTPRVQALTRDQVLAMTPENFGYISGRLTAEQRAWR